MRQLEGQRKTFQRDRQVRKERKRERDRARKRTAGENHTPRCRGYCFIE